MYTQKKGTPLINLLPFKTLHFPGFPKNFLPPQLGKTLVPNYTKGPTLWGPKISKNKSPQSQRKGLTPPGLVTHPFFGNVLWYPILFTKPLLPIDPNPTTFGTQFLYNGGCFHRRPTCSDNIFTDKNSLVFTHLKSSAKFHLTIFSFYKNGTKSQCSSQFITAQYTTEGGGHRWYLFLCPLFLISIPLKAFAKFFPPVFGFSSNLAL